MPSASRLLAYTSELANFTHRLLSSSFLELPYRILDMKHKKKLLRSLSADPPLLRTEPLSKIPGLLDLEILEALGSSIAPNCQH